VQAVQVGARAVLEKPVSPDALVQAVCRLLVREQASATLLAVDDDQMFHVLIEELLSAQGLVVECVNDAGGPSSR
jgi:CheY-like chemotaxis protein